MAAAGAVRNSSLSFDLSCISAELDTAVMESVAAGLAAIREAIEAATIAIYDTTDKLSQQIASLKAKENETSDIEVTLKPKQNEFFDIEGMRQQIIENATVLYPFLKLSRWDNARKTRYMTPNIFVVVHGAGNHFTARVLYDEVHPDFCFAAKNVLMMGPQASNCASALKGLLDGSCKLLNDHISTGISYEPRGMVKASDDGFFYWEKS